MVTGALELGSIAKRVFPNYKFDPRPQYSPATMSLVSAGGDADPNPNPSLGPNPSLTPTLLPFTFPPSLLRLDVRPIHTPRQVRTASHIPLIGSQIMTEVERVASCTAIQWNNSASRRELGIHYRPLEDTVKQVR